LAAEGLAEVVFAYNSTPHSSTGFAPNYMQFHRHVKSPLGSILIESVDLEASQAVRDGTVRRLAAEMQAGEKVAEAELAQDRRLLEDNKVDYRRELDVGDKAWIFNEQSSRAMESKYSDTVTIVGKHGPNAYIVENQKGITLQKPVNIRRLIKWSPPVDPVNVDIGGAEKEMEKRGEIRQNIKPTSQSLEYIYVPEVSHSDVEDKAQVVEREEAPATDDEMNSSAAESVDLVDFSFDNDPDDDNVEEQDPLNDIRHGEDATKAAIATECDLVLKKFEASHARDLVKANQQGLEAPIVYGRVTDKYLITFKSAIDAVYDDRLKKRQIYDIVLDQTKSVDRRAKDVAHLISQL
jgi:hypothetical protein